MRKNILMLTSTWNHDYLSILVKGISERLENEDIGLHIFNAYDEVTETMFYACDKEIFSLPNIDNYIGMIAVFNSVDSGRSMNQYLSDFMATGKPALSIDQHAEGVPFFGLDNYESMYKLVEHMIKDHGCKTLNYVGGPETHEENQERYRAYLDCLKANNIPIDNARIKHYRFLVNDGNKAYDDFKQLGVHLPDAVICANDYMAFGYCNAAKADGYSSPEDFLITGFDNVLYGQTYFPSITSINRNWERLGYDAAEGLLHMVSSNTLIDKHHTVGYIRYNESCSCGCQKRDIKSDYLQLLEKLDTSQIWANVQDDARKILCSTPDLASLPDAMYRSARKLKIDSYSVVLNESFFTAEYNAVVPPFSPEMTAYLESGTEVLNIKDNLVPKALMDEEHDIYIFASIHFSHQIFGYCVMPFNAELIRTANHRLLMENIALSLTNIKQRLSLDMMNSQLKELYVQDALTGLYNRFGYNNFAQKFYDKYEGCVYILCMDLDKLKEINDRYGHDHGDKAIKAVAEAIKTVFPGNEIKVRTGGDEFLIIGALESEEDIVESEKKIHEYLENYREKHMFPVPIDVSIGHITNSGMDAEMTLDLLIQWADQKMYDIKQRHHANHPGALRY